MQANRTVRRNRQQQRHPNQYQATNAPLHQNGDGRLARIRDREQVDLVCELDDAYDDLIGRALKDGDPTAYGLAQIVRAAADYLANLRERQNNGV